MESAFKKGDRVYSFPYGWGTIMDIDVNVGVKFESLGSLRYFNGEFLKFLSFTEYKLEGFSQKRPEPLPNKGDIVWVRDSYSEAWRVVHFCGMHNKYFKASNIYNDPTSPCWNFMTTENPYKYEHKD